MRPAEYRALVSRAEAFATAYPRAYVAAVVGWLALGYGYVSVVVIGLLASVALVGYAIVSGTGMVGLVKLLIPLVAVAWSAIRAMASRVPPPEGMRLTAGSSPAFERLVHETARAIGVRIDEIIIDHDFNASVVQRPRLLFFGFPRNILAVGIPLLGVLSEDEFRSVLAHEAGHLSGQHAQFSGLIYRTRLVWERLLTQIGDQGWLGNLLFVRFARWFGPRFSGYSIVLARRHEFGADTRAAELVGADVSRRALARLSVGIRGIAESHWKPMWARAETEPLPPADPWAGIADNPAIRAPEASAAWLAERLALATDVDDSHPSFAARLTNLGWSGTPESLAAELRHDTAPAAITLLSDSIVKASAVHLLADVAPAWKARAEEVARARAALARNEAAEADGTLTPDQEVEGILARVDTGGWAGALPAARAFAAANPGDARAHYLLGMGLIADKDDTGEAELERALAADPSLLPTIGQTLYDRAWQRGDTAAAQRWEEAIHDRRTLEQQADAERSSLPDKKDLVAAGLDGAVRAAIATDAAAVPGLRGLYIVRRTVKGLQEPPCYVVFADAGHRWWWYLSERKMTAVVQGVAQIASLPNDSRIFRVQAASEKAWKHARTLAGARIV